MNPKRVDFLGSQGIPRISPTVRRHNHVIEQHLLVILVPRIGIEFVAGMEYGLES